MIGQPRLATLGLAPDPVPQDESLIRVALFLDGLPVGKLPLLSKRNARVCRNSLHPEIQRPQSGNLREIQSRSIRRPAWSADRRHIVVRDRVHDERHVFTQERKPVGGAEVAKPRPRIVTALFLIPRRIIHREETLKKEVKVHRRMPRSTEDDRPRKRKLKVVRRSKRTLF